jgi:hypothetical protein
MVDHVVEPRPRTLEDVLGHSQPACSTLLHDDLRRQLDLRDEDPQVAKSDQGVSRCLRIECLEF